MRIGAWISAVFAVAAIACSDPFFHIDTAPPPPAAEETCEAGSDWLPDTPDLELFKPAPHPASECSFYRASWQNFLIATQPGEDGTIALQSLATIDDVFQRTVPRPEPRAWLGDVKQAGARQILIDENSRPIYYGIHVNETFADFVTDNHLQTADGIRAAPSNLFLPSGLVELKSAWQEVDESDDPSSSTFITARARVSRLRQEHAEILEDHSSPREINVRLIALHVAFALPGHPELIWSTFEHAGADGEAHEVAPVHPGENPKLTDPNNQQDSSIVSSDDAILFRAGTRTNAANQAIAESDLHFDADSQTFPGAHTSIYRMFPASKSNTAEQDEAIVSLNESVRARFEHAGNLRQGDKRGNYRLVGAVWMDKPEYFATDATLENDTTSPFAHRPDFVSDIQANGSDSELSILAGEDRLSSVAMESFTQSPAAFPNCFSCHNTQAVTEKGIPIDRDRQGALLLEPKQIGVSHVFSQFLLDEANESR